MMSNIITIEMSDTSDISFPLEWLVQLDLTAGFVQITLVDDRIVIHKPTAADVSYTKPCKVGENSYIRKMGLFNVRVPKQLFEMLQIASGDIIDLSLEKNCISICKSQNDESEHLKPDTSEPIMAFCCVCGSLLYTEGLVKVSVKYICRECVDLVRALRI